MAPTNSEQVAVIGNGVKKNSTSFRSADPRAILAKSVPWETQWSLDRLKKAAFIVKSFDIDRGVCLLSTVSIIYYDHQLKVTTVSPILWIVYSKDDISSDVAVAEMLAPTTPFLACI